MDDKALTEMAVKEIMMQLQRQTERDTLPLERKINPLGRRPNKRFLERTLHDVKSYNKRAKDRTERNCARKLLELNERQKKRKMRRRCDNRSRSSTSRQTISSSSSLIEEKKKQKDRRKRHKKRKKKKKEKKRKTCKYSSGDSSDKEERRTEHNNLISNVAIDPSYSYAAQMAAGAAYTQYWHYQTFLAGAAATAAAVAGVSLENEAKALEEDIKAEINQEGDVDEITAEMKAELEEVFDCNDLPHHKASKRLTVRNSKRTMKGKGMPLNTIEVCTSSNSSVASSPISKKQLNLQNEALGQLADEAICVSSSLTSSDDNDESCIFLNSEDSRSTSVKAKINECVTLNSSNEDSDVEYLGE